MHDDETAISNACTDLLSLRAMEAFPLRLLGGQRPGEWVVVGAFCRQIGVVPDDLTPGLFATWLPDPSGHDGYAVILFYDDESKWSMAAQYNRGRLLGSATPSLAGQLAGAGVPAPAGATSPTVPPAGRR
jgi:hypothetical protein